MIAEYKVFSKLIEKHGVPRRVIRNTPSCSFRRGNSGPFLFAETPPIGLDPLSARVGYCRVPLGHESFLQIRRYVEVDARAFNSARRALLEMRVVELLRGVTVRGPRGGDKQVVRIAVEEDVSPLSAGEFDKAIRQCRMLSVHSERWMGDIFIRFEVVRSVDPGITDGFCFLFDADCRLTDAELYFNPSEGSWDSAGEIIHCFRRDFTRPLVS